MPGTDYNAFFCWSCGSKVDRNAKKCPRCGARYSGKTKYGDAVALGAGGVGWSERAYDPFFRKYAGKYVKLSVGWMIGLSILIPLILLLTGQVQPYGEGVAVLIGVPAIICLIAIIFLLRKFSGGNKSWEGVVENKSEESKVRIVRGKTDGSRQVHYMEYIISFRLSDGSTKQLRDEDNASNFTYFKIGDHVRYHHTKYMKYLEKYDKSRDDALFCAACGTLNDARDVYCGRCGAPMLKGNPDIPSAYAVRARNAAAAPAFCESCGARLTGGAFCESCGASVK